MKRFDLVEKLKHRDYSMFRDEFELLDPAHMQQQSLDQLYAHEIFHEWMEEELKVVNVGKERVSDKKGLFCFPELSSHWKTLLNNFI